jgi:hypothetical protein
MKKMYDLYAKNECELKRKSASYKIYCEVFRQTGYKCKMPHNVTCKVCSELIKKLISLTEISEKKRGGGGRS